MDPKTIQEVLDVLDDIQKELRGNAEMRPVRRKVKRVIRVLKKALESGRTDGVTASKVLALIGDVIGKVPIIVQAIEALTKLGKQ